MSENNNDRSSARERLQAEREKEKARARRGRQLKMGGAVVAVLAVAGGVATWAASGGRDGATNASVAMAKGTSAGAKPAVPVGKADAPATLQVWEDFRCPACMQFETSFRDTLHQLVDDGTLRVDYHLVTIIDDNTGGTGSLRAGNAALCAQDAGRFRAYHDMLYAHQPDERQDGFSDRKYLVKLAGKVPGLATDRFTRCVEGGTYDAFVRKSATAFGSSGFRGTPTILLNGKNIFGDTTSQLTVAKFKKMVLDAAGRKGEPNAPTGSPTAPTSAPGSPSASAPAGTATS